MMVPPCFHSALRIEKIGPHLWRLTDDLIFESVLLQGAVVVPRGAVTDFASTPRFLWWLIPKSGQHDYATTVHDAAYRGALHTISGERIRLIRRLADLLMDEANESVGVSPTIRRLMLRGVQVFGGRAYTGVPDGQHTRHQESRIDVGGDVPGGGAA